MRGQTPETLIQYYRPRSPASRWSGGVIRAPHPKPRTYSRALPPYLAPLAIITAIVLIPILLLSAGNFVGDRLIVSLRQAEQGRIDRWWKDELDARATRYQPWANPKPGTEYVIEWGNDHLRIRSRGTLQHLSELPREGNRIGDFFNVVGESHIFVWLSSASGPGWVDP